MSLSVSERFMEEEGVPEKEDDDEEVKEVGDEGEDDDDDVVVVDDDATEEKVDMEDGEDIPLILCLILSFRLALWLPLSSL